jgi:hypothetical protein
VWSTSTPDSVTRQRSATVLVNGAYANVVATANDGAFDRILSNLRVASATDRNRLTQLPTHALGDEVVVGNELQSGILPDGARWKVVENSFPVTSVRLRVVGIETLSGAVLAVEFFPRTSSVNWMRTDPDMTIVAMPSSTEPKTISAMINGKKQTAHFVPATGFLNHYAFFPGELHDTDAIEVIVGIDNRVRTAKDFRWEPTDRHL